MPDGSISLLWTSRRRMSLSQTREANIKASQLSHINNLLEESKTKMGASCCRPGHGVAYGGEGRAG